MSNHSPITPPTELVQQWENRIFDEQENVDVLLIEAYKAGADQALEATLKLMATLNIRGVDYVRNARRSARASSLKEQALSLIEQHENVWRPSPKDWDTIRKALEAL